MCVSSYISFQLLKNRTQTIAQRKYTVLKARGVSEELKVTDKSLHIEYLIYNNFQSQISHY